MLSKKIIILLVFVLFFGFASYVYAGSCSGGWKDILSWSVSDYCCGSNVCDTRFSCAGIVGKSVKYDCSNGCSGGRCNEGNPSCSLPSCGAPPSDGAPPSPPSGNMCDDAKTGNAPSGWRYMVHYACEDSCHTNRAGEVNFPSNEEVTTACNRYGASVNTPLGSCGTKEYNCDICAGSQAPSWCGAPGGPPPSGGSCTSGEPSRPSFSSTIFPSPSGILFKAKWYRCQNFDSLVRETSESVNINTFKSGSHINDPAWPQELSFGRDWGGGDPDGSGGVDSDHFSIAFTGRYNFRNARYEFWTQSDDGSIMYLDGSSVVDNWGHHGMDRKSSTIDVSEGAHTIKVAMFEDTGGAGIRFGFKWIQDIVTCSPNCAGKSCGGDGCGGSCGSCGSGQTCTAQGTCQDSCVGISCDDGNPCTTDSCSGGQCSHSTKADGTPCGGDKYCQGGSCVAVPPRTVIPDLDGDGSVDGMGVRNECGTSFTCVGNYDLISPSGVDFADFVEFVRLFNLKDGRVDYKNDGTFNSCDFICFAKIGYRDEVTLNTFQCLITNAYANPDHDKDGDVDFQDFVKFAQCSGKQAGDGIPGVPNCNIFDFDNDFKIDNGNDFKCFVQLYGENFDCRFGCGDGDGDGDVDFDDLKFGFGPCFGAPSSGKAGSVVCKRFDYNDDGWVNEFDFICLKKDFGSSAVGKSQCSLVGEACGSHGDCDSPGESLYCSGGHCCVEGESWDEIGGCGRAGREGELCTCLFSQLEGGRFYIGTLNRLSKHFTKDRDNCWDDAEKTACVLTSKFSRQPQKRWVKVVTY